MKKVIVCAIAMFTVSLIYAETPAEAQVVILTNRCCDAEDNMRCRTVNMFPVNDPCFCPYQGWGHGCL
jgi:hypothetical protein